MTSNKNYQWLIVGLLSLNFGVVFFDRNAFGYLAPYIQPDLKLTNTQIGLIGGAFSGAWAIAGLLMGSISDRYGRRKTILVISTLIFSLASVLSGFAGTFLAMLGARMLMGIAEGGIMPITQTVVASEVSPEKRGLAHGITQNFGANVLANTLGPIIIFWLANHFGWQKAFYIVAIPGFVMAFLIAIFMREPTQLDRHPKPTLNSAVKLLANRNVLVSVLISIFLVAFLVVLFNFMALYLINTKGISPSNMGLVLAGFGVASILIAFIVPGLSDVVGRKPVAIIASLLGILTPLSVMWMTGTEPWPYFFAMAAGAAISGVFPIAMATIPSEVVPPGLTATALSLTMGISEVVGGVLAPIYAGVAADRYGQVAPLWVCIAMALAAAVAALFLKETAPKVLARRGR